MDSQKSETPGSNDTGRSRRSWKNVLQSPAGQVRLVFVIPIVGLLVVIFLLQFLKLSVVTRLESFSQEGNAERILDLSGVMGNLFNLGIGFVVVSVVMLTVFAIAISHRYYGPLVPILRAVRGMKNGDYNQKIQLRTEDELQELATALNELSAELSAKHGQK